MPTEVVALPSMTVRALAALHHPRDIAPALIPRTAGAQISMSAQGQPTENAYAERFMRTLKEEEVYLHEYQDFADASTHIAHFMDHVYMHKRVHSALGYLLPAEFEALWRATEKPTMEAASGAACAGFEAAPAAPEAIAAERHPPVTEGIS